MYPLGLQKQLNAIANAVAAAVNDTTTAASGASSSAPLLPELCQLVAHYVWTARLVTLSHRLPSLHVVTTAAELAYPRALALHTRPTVAWGEPPLVYPLALHPVLLPDRLATPDNLGPGLAVVPKGSPTGPTLERVEADASGRLEELCHEQYLLVCGSNAFAVRQMPIPREPGAVVACTQLWSTRLLGVAGRHSTALSVVVHPPSGDVFVNSSTTISRYTSGHDARFVAGASAVEGYVDGAGFVARFRASSLLCSRDGQRLYVMDFSNHRIRLCEGLNDKRGVTVRTVAGTGEPLTAWAPTDECDGHALKHVIMREPKFGVFDRRTDAPDTVLYITSFYGLWRFDTTTGMVTRLTAAAKAAPRPYGILALDSGWLVLSCVQRHNLVGFDPRSGRTQLLCGTPDGSGAPNAVSEPALGSRLSWPIGMVLHPNAAHGVIVADNFGHAIRCAQLPPTLFEPTTPNFAPSATPTTSASVSPAA